MANFIQIVVKRLMENTEGLNLPMEQTKLEEIWEENLKKYLIPYSVEKDSFYEIYNLVKEATIGNISQENLKVVNSSLMKSAEQLAFIYDRSELLQRFESTQELLEKLYAVDVQAVSKLENSVENYYQKDSFYYKKVSIPKAKIKFYYQLLEFTKQHQEAYQPLQKIIKHKDWEYKNLYEDIVTEVLNSSIRDMNAQIKSMLLEFKKDLAEAIQSEFGLVPQCLVEVAHNELKSYLSQKWQVLCFNRSHILESNLMINSTYILTQLNNSEIELFHSISSDKCFHLAKIITYSMPEHSGNNLQLEFLLQSLQVSKQEVLNTPSIQKHSKYWLVHSNTDERVICILSLVLVLSNSYTAFYKQQQVKYDPWNRQWLRNIVYNAFEINFQSLFSHEKLKTEWSVCTLAEQAVSEFLGTIGESDWCFDKAILDFGDRIPELASIPEKELKQNSKIANNLMNTLSEYNKESKLQKFINFFMKNAHNLEVSFT